MGVSLEKKLEEMSVQREWAVYRKGEQVYRIRKRRTHLGKGVMEQSSRNRIRGETNCLLSIVQLTGE